MVDRQRAVAEEQYPGDADRGSERERIQPAPLDALRSGHRERHEGRLAALL